MSTAPLNPLVEKIRSAHPGSYDDMDDATLTKAVLRKYPQYSDLAAPPVPAPQLDMQTEGGGLAGPAAGKLTGLPGVNPHEPTTEEGLSDTALVASGAAGGMFGPQVVKAALPFLAPAAASYAINKARELPVIGPVIKHIPFAEMLPFLAMGGKGKAATAEAETAGAAQIERDATRMNKPFAGDEMVAPVAPKTAPIYRDATSQNKPFAGDGLPWNSKNTEVPPETAVTHNPISAPANAGEALQRQVTQTKPTPSAFTSTSAPTVPSTREIRDSRNRGYNSPDARSERELGLSMQQQVDEEGAQMEELARREFAAGNTTGVTKGELARKARIQKPSTPTATPDEDVVPLMEKMLKNARKGKPVKP